MSSMNIGGLGFGKSSKQMVKKDSSPSRSKSPTKDKCSLTKIDVIEEVRESRDGHASSALDTNIGIEAILNRDSNLTPARERADTMKSNSPFKINLRNSGNRGAKIKKKVKKCLDHNHEVPAHIKKSPRWQKIESLNKDLDNVSLNFLNYTSYLQKVKREIEREQHRAELELLSEQSSVQGTSRKHSKIMTLS